MPTDDFIDRVSQGLKIEVTGQPEVACPVVHDAYRIELLLEPESLLCEGKRTLAAFGGSICSTETGSRGVGVLQAPRPAPHASPAKAGYAYRPGRVVKSSNVVTLKTEREGRCQAQGGPRHAQNDILDDEGLAREHGGTKDEIPREFDVEHTVESSNHPGGPK